MSMQVNSENGVKNETDPSGAAQSKMISNAARALIAYRESVLILVILIFGLCMTFASPVFLSWRNIEAILLALSVEATIAIGMPCVTGKPRTRARRRGGSGVMRCLP